VIITNIIYFVDIKPFVLSQHTLALPKTLFHFVHSSCILLDWNMGCKNRLTHPKGGQAKKQRPESTSVPMQPVQPAPDTVNIDWPSTFHASQQVDNVPDEPASQSRLPNINLPSNSFAPNLYEHVLEHRDMHSGTASTHQSFNESGQHPRAVCVCLTSSDFHPKHTSRSPSARMGPSC